MGSLTLGQNARVAVVHDNSERFPKQMPWDILPIKLWVEEHGGVVVGIDGSDYRVDHPMPIIFAANRMIADGLLGGRPKASSSLRDEDPFGQRDPSGP